ncbi:hypothetical protein KW798_01720 [Candidatus Parcubacteria bacterium]|nr:hypothetical protein [Candidatus Parcubacteria bacterium]
MPPRAYLPSAQFVLLVGSLFVSAGLIYGAQLVTKPSNAALNPVGSTGKQDEDWDRTLAEIQSQDPSYSLPEAPSDESVSAFLNAAEDANITDTIGRTLLVNLSAAKSQGLGDDIPTQEQLIEQAKQYLPSTAKVKQYTSAQLTIAAPGLDAMHTYGNAVITALSKHPDTQPQRTFVTVGMATDSGDKSYLDGLPRIQKEYEALVAELIATPVPQTLAPLHLQLINDLAHISTLYGDIGTVFTDPIRSLSALQSFQSHSDEVGRVFTTLAQELSKNAILFTKDEPGSAWSGLISAQLQ